MCKWEFSGYNKGFIYIFTYLFMYGQGAKGVAKIGLGVICLVKNIGLESHIILANLVYLNMESYNNLC